MKVNLKLKKEVLMKYKKCSRCGVFTDENEKKCPNCYKKFSRRNGKVVDLEELVSMIKSSELDPQKIFTKKTGVIIKKIST